MSNQTPWVLLQTFVEVADRRNFTKAADALALTTSAVSHRVRRLEDWVGLPLMQRDAHQVSLTPAGETLLAELLPAFQQIETAARRARDSAGSSARLTITALPLIAETWLAPKLQQLRQQWPEMQFEVDTSNEVRTLDAVAPLLAIRNLQRRPRGRHWWPLLTCRVLPVCTPQLAPRVQDPEALHSLPLLEIGARPGGWQRWFNRYAPELQPPQPMRFDSLPVALQSAARGEGVLLGMSPLMWLGAAGKHLTAPLPDCTLDAGTYYIGYNGPSDVSGRLAEIAAHLLQEMKRDEPALREVEERAMA